MTHYFLDSSALVKRYVNETGSQWIRSLLADPSEHTILIAQITPVEVYSATMRRVREGALDLTVSSHLRLALMLHLEHQYRVVLITPQVIWQAQGLLERHPLRAFDAVQLASAVTANERLVGGNLTPLVFVSADGQLIQAAVIEGLLTEDPNKLP